MNELKIGGKVKNIRLNNNIVTVIAPKNPVSYEEGTRRIEKLISEIKKK